MCSVRSLKQETNVSKNAILSGHVVEDDVRNALSGRGRCARLIRREKKKINGQGDAR